jgi:glyoxylate reductase
MRRRGDGALPPPADVLRAKAAKCDGPLSLLTDKIDAALMDACPVARDQGLRCRLNVDIPAATDRGIRVGNTPGEADRRDG